MLNRVAEDGVLPEWFRQPQRKYGTTHRLIAAVAILQIATVVISRGDVTLLGEAYAFGVAWSFAMKALGVTVLRFTRPDAERWRVPLNLRLGGTELPLGLMLITAMLFLLAGVNLLTKQAATIGGVSFTLVFFVLFSICERRHNRGGALEGHQGADRFRLDCRHDLSPTTLGIRPDGVLVGIHDPDHLGHLEELLAGNDPQAGDVVALSVNDDCATSRLSDGEAAEQIVDDWETRVFSRAVAVAEKAGKPIFLLALPSDDRYETVLQAAVRLQSHSVVLASSSRESAQEQAVAIRAAWSRLHERRRALTVQIASDGGASPTHIALDR